MTLPGSHARKKEMREKRARHWEREAVNSLTAEALFFGRSYVPIREIRNRLDPVLRAHEIREITKLDISGKDEDEEE